MPFCSCSGGLSIRAVPLTGLFDSLILLALIFGVLYLLLRPSVDQVWFGSVMVWAILGMVLVAALVAKPASRPQEVAADALGGRARQCHDPGDGLDRVCGGQFRPVSARQLQAQAQRRSSQVLGRIPNMETLVRMNRLGVRVGFVLLTVGVVSGLGLLAGWHRDRQMAGG